MNVTQKRVASVIPVAIDSIRDGDNKGVQIEVEGLGILLTVRRGKFNHISGSISFIEDSGEVRSAQFHQYPEERWALHALQSFGTQKDE